MLEKAKFYSEYQGYKLTYYITYTRHSNRFGVGIESQKMG